MKVLITEHEIMGKVSSDWNKPQVTFMCTTYNQESYIEEAIIGFLNQKTTFPYEIIIHDDCSIDGTREVIEKYQKKYPNIIRSIFQVENQYSKGNSVSEIAAHQARAEYIASCEGDDYWTNEDKIQKQFELMLSDSTISMIVTPGKVEVGGKILDKIEGFHGDHVKTISAQDILNMRESLAPTASYFVKKEYLLKTKSLFRRAPVGDLFIELYCAANGKLVYLPEVSCVYRCMAKNSWSERMSRDIGNAVRHTESMKKIINESKDIQGFENLDWSAKLSQSYFNLAALHFKSKKFTEYRKYIDISNSYKKLHGKQRILLYSKTVAPTLYLVIMAAIKLRKKF